MPKKKMPMKPKGMHRMPGEGHMMSDKEMADMMGKGKKKPRKGGY